MGSTKTDNHDPRAKLELRRYFLRRYHADEPPDVLDCCQGSALLWSQLRSEFSVRTYWGVDLKPKKGRLKLDSVRILAQAGWPQNVVDIDTYGSPWKHWLAMLPHISRPTTVFLTVGQVHMAGSPVQNVVKEALGIGELKVPNAIGARLNQIAVTWLLSRGCGYCTIMEAVEAESTGNARYIGVRLVPAQANGRGAPTPGRSEHPEPIEEVQNV
jgi:hypothetical protein